MRALARACLLLLLASCAPPEPHFERHLYTFGTEARIELRGLDRTAAAALADRVERRLNRWNRDWYAWGDGALGELNLRLAEHAEAVTTAELGALLRHAGELRTRSGGLFDPSVGTLVGLWQFDGRAELTAEAPSAAALAAAASGRSFTVIIDGDHARVRTSRPGLRLDLGGVAKGAALDALRTMLVDAAVPAAIIDIGGDVLVVDRDGNADLTVGLRDPRRDGAMAYLHAGDGEVVVTSGDYARFRDVDGERIHHIIDPRSGRPGTGARAVTVVDTRAALADASATALMVAGPLLFHETCQRMGVKYALMIDADGNAHTTPALAPRLIWLQPSGAATP